MEALTICAPWDPNTKFKLKLRSPWDPEVEYQLKWAKKSLWERRFEHLQQSSKELDYLCKANGDSSDSEDEETWMMDGSNSVACSDRWGETRSVGGDDDEQPVFDRWVNHCASQSSASRWGEQADPLGSSVHSQDTRPSAPSRSSSPIPDESLQDDSESVSYAVSWLEGIYDTVRDIRERRASATSEGKESTSANRKAVIRSV